MEKITKNIKEHPNVLALIIVFLAGTIFFNQTEIGFLSLGKFSFLEMLLAVVLGSLIYSRVKLGSDNLHIIIKAALGIGFIGGVYIISIIRSYGLGSLTSNIVTVFMFVLLLSLIVVVYALYRSRQISAEQIIGLIIFSGILLRFAYVLFTSISEMQNDIGELIDGQGHLGYIYYLYSYKQLPDFDPRFRLQFYHPPLHHAISALWLGLNTKLGFDLSRAGENIQMLTLVYSSCILFTANGILKKLKADVYTRMGALGVLAFFPYFVMQAGSVNNDTLVTLLMAVSLYLALKWYDEPNFKNIILLGISIGSAMMTKVSGGFVAFAVAFLFVVKLVKERKKVWTFIKQYTVFGVITVPLGLWYPVKNKILYDLPLNYVQELPKELEQYIEKYNTVFQRLFDFSLNQFSSPAIVWSNQDSNCDHNIFITMIKCAAFGEGNWFQNDAFKIMIGRMVFWVLAALLISLTVLFVYWVVKSKLELEKRIYALITVVVVFGLYIKFCFEYMFICTMNVRYVLIPLMLLVIGGMLGAGQIRESKNSWVINILHGVQIAFGILCVMLFIGYFLVH